MDVWVASIGRSNGRYHQQIFRGTVGGDYHWYRLNGRFWLHTLGPDNLTPIPVPIRPIAVTDPGGRYSGLYLTSELCIGRNIARAYRKEMAPRMDAFLAGAGLE